MTNIPVLTALYPPHATQRISQTESGRNDRNTTQYEKEPSGPLAWCSFPVYLETQRNRTAINESGFRADTKDFQVEVANFFKINCYDQTRLFDWQPTEGGRHHCRTQRSYGKSFSTAQTTLCSDEISAPSHATECMKEVTRGVRLVRSGAIRDPGEP